MDSTPNNRMSSLNWCFSQGFMRSFQCSNRLTAKGFRVYVYMVQLVGPATMCPLLHLLHHLPWSETSFYMIS